MAPGPRPMGDTMVPSRTMKRSRVGNHTSWAVSAWKTRLGAGAAPCRRSAGRLARRAPRAATGRTKGEPCDAAGCGSACVQLAPSQSSKVSPSQNDGRWARTRITTRRQLAPQRGVEVVGEAEEAAHARRPARAPGLASCGDLAVAGERPGTPASAADARRGGKSSRPATCGAGSTMKHRRPPTTASRQGAAQAAPGRPPSLAEPTSPPGPTMPNAAHATT